MLSAMVRSPALRLSLMLAAMPRPSVPQLSVPHRRHWLSSMVLATMAGLYLFAGLSVAPIGGAGGAASAKVSGDLASLPGLRASLTAPMQFKPVAPEDALSMNAAVPVSDLPNPAAKAFLASLASETDRARSLKCLTTAIYYEAATEPLEGQRAVAQVILNRSRHPAYPNTVCGVVFQGSQRVTGCQFSFTCDGSLRRTPMASYWARARNVAEQALGGYVHAPVGHATHYHANYVVPYWASSLVKIANIGTHIFYRWSGGWGRPAAFSQRYRGAEPDVSGLGRRTADPVLVAVTPAEGVDAAAAAAAAAAAGVPGAPGAQPGQPVGSIDSFQRAVLRRYEPLSREAATARAIARTGEPAPSSLRWALSGEGNGAAGTPLGRRPTTPPTTTTAPAKSESPAAPKCLEGVRKRGQDGQAVEQQTC